MNSLNRVQKTFRVFEILSKAAMILSFLWAAVTAAGLLCGFAWYSGVSVAGVSRETLLVMTRSSTLNQMTGVLLSELVFALTDGALFLLSFRYFRQEQEDGTPFTRDGAEQIRYLGIWTIALPLAAVVLASAFREVFGVSGAGDWGNRFSVTLGVVLILASLIFRCGAELEECSRVC
ncbi:hypothetical protein [Dysosmobacter sp.]|uniref:hypothetical protein n=1 Tax=Dysosmobacter sp. TaxID=2591382 RepID=UPI002A853FE1|nr:hypothetical protein [Dysosmobacter sp.]MDY3281304.1 hypothetical protein [Dysosmobacter sp.]